MIFCTGPAHSASVRACKMSDESVLWLVSEF